MSVRLKLESGEILERVENSITIGSSTSCQVVIANDRRVGPVHATLRKMGNRWLLETLGPPQVCVDDSGPMQRHWLQQAGQVIRLTPNGPPIVFEPPVESAPPLAKTPDRILDIPQESLIEDSAPRRPKAKRDSGDDLDERRVNSGKSESSQQPDESPGANISSRRVSLGLIGLAGALLVLVPCSYLAWRAVFTPRVGVGEVQLPPGKQTPEGEQGDSKPELSIEQRRENVRRATVWIGAVFDGQTYPLTTGVLVSPTEIATTAFYIVKIRDEYLKSGKFERFVAFYADDQNQIEITDFQPHPKYENNGRTSDHYNIGVISLAKSMAHHVVPAPRQLQQDALKPKNAVELMGYPLSSSEMKPFNPLAKPEVVSYRGNIEAITAPDDEPQQFTLLSLQLKAPDGTEGGPIIDAGGNLIAIALSGAEAKTTRPAILIDRLHGIPRH